MTVAVLQIIGLALAVVGTAGALRAVGRPFPGNSGDAESDIILRLVKRHAEKTAPADVLRRFHKAVLWWLVLLSGVFVSIAAAVVEKIG